MDKIDFKDLMQKAKAGADDGIKRNNSTNACAMVYNNNNFDKIEKIKVYEYNS